MKGNERNGMKTEEATASAEDYYYEDDEYEDDE